MIKIGSYKRLEDWYDNHYDLGDLDLDEFKGLLVNNDPPLHENAVDHLEKWFQRKTGYKLITHKSGKRGYVRYKRGKWSGKWQWV